MKKKVLAISGSTRKNSSNEKILKFIAKLYSETLDVQIFSQIDVLPHFNPDVADKTPPPTVAIFLDLIKHADGVLICTPEYVFSLPGTLKNALEWSVSSTVFTDKPCAFIVASGLGEKAFESLGIIMQTLIQNEVPEECKLLIQGARGKLNADGEFSDAVLIGEIRKVIDAFITSMNTTSPSSVR
jgi:NAD(P)H-dependent FMN reductase